VYNNIDLLALKAPSKEPTRYATKVAGVLFTREELLNGMIPPLSHTGTKVEFDKEKVALLRKCMARKYGDKVLQKYWPEIRRSVNQKGNDLRKKEKPKLTEKSEEASGNDATKDSSLG